MLETYYQGSTCEHIFSQQYCKCDSHQPISEHNGNKQTHVVVTRDVALVSISDEFWNKFEFFIY